MERAPRSRAESAPSTGSTATTGSPAGTGRWWTGAVPVVLAVAVLTALAFWLVPGGSEQAATSLTRQPQPVVELAFTRPEVAQQCRVQGHGLVVAVTVTTSDVDTPFGFSLTSSRLRPLPGRSTVGVAGHESGTVPGDDGAHRFVRRLRVPTGGIPFKVSVTLAGHPESLLLRCAQGSQTSRGTS